MPFGFSFGSTASSSAAAPPSSAALPHRDYNYLFKVVMAGHSGGGKTQILNAFAGAGFSDHTPHTIGVDFKIRTIKINDHRIKLQIWDTAGSERFRTITTAYFRFAVAVMLVYDHTRADGIESVADWKQTIDEAFLGFNYNPTQRAALVRPCFVVVAAKQDLQQGRYGEPTSAAAGRAYAESIDAGFAECSAKEGRGIDGLFDTIAAMVLSNINNSDTAAAVDNGSNSTRRAAVATRLVVLAPPSTMAGARTSGTCC